MSSNRSEVVYRTDAELVAGLRTGEESAFRALVDSHHQMLLRTARIYVRSEAVAEEVVQETWLAVLNGIGRFEERSSLRTWIVGILLKRARSIGSREDRHASFATGASKPDRSAPTVSGDRFLVSPDPSLDGHWSRPPAPWDADPERRLLTQEALERLSAAIEDLPPNQRQVITLRDVEGWTSAEVCNALDISELQPWRSCRAGAGVA